MSVRDDLAHRLPAGWVGRWILAPLWNRRNVALNDVALAALALRADDQVLEVGCGGGYLLGRMAERVSLGTLTGVDAGPAMIAHCMRRHCRLVRTGRLVLQCAPAEALPFAEARFTQACSVNSLFYWSDVRQGLRELYRVLIPGGRLVLCLTTKASLLRQRALRGHVRAFEESELREMLGSVGFRVASVETHSDRYRDFLCIVSRKEHAQ
jgi:ubiquinone/menaquinone biosynthesis C-methylase UbiE